jgi:hypothetical protein
MSEKCWGVFEFARDDLTYIQVRDMSFQIVSAAVNHRIGVLLGPNVETYLRPGWSNIPKSLEFELADGFEDNTTTVLLGSDGIKHLFMGERVDLGESLASRLGRLEQFLQDVLKVQYVQRIIMTIDEAFSGPIEGIDEGAFHISIRAGDFEEVMMERFRKRNMLEDAVKLTITAD